MTESSNTKRVLVTGASGFIGRQSLEPLQRRGFEVHAVYLTKPLDGTHGVTWHKADLLNENDSRVLCQEVRPTHLLHFAWYVHPKDYKTSSKNEQWVRATLALMRAFKEHGGERAVLAGTAMEYDWSIPQDFLSESNSPLRPANPYGKSKHETHLASLAFARDHKLSFAWGRIFLLYGPYEAPARLVPYIINALLDNKIAECTSGEQIRDILHVADVGDAFAALIDSPIEGAVNIGSGSPTPLKEIILTIGDILEKRECIRLGAISTDEAPRLVFDTGRLMNEVGWRPRYTLENGLRETIEWWKENRAQYRYSSQ